MHTCWLYINYNNVPLALLSHYLHIITAQGARGISGPSGILGAPGAKVALHSPLSVALQRQLSLTLPSLANNTHSTSRLIDYIACVYVCMYVVTWYFAGRGWKARCRWIQRRQWHAGKHTFLCPCSFVSSYYDSLSLLFSEGSEGKCGFDWFPWTCGTKGGQG